ncbi:MAG: ligand-binding sensor domain-containing protein, partial [Bacteroidota bacterium]
MIRLLLLAGLLAFAQSFLFAQEKDIKFHHITVDDGLSSNTVNAVIRDSRGFIWISTGNGVSRYDGYTFTNFRSHEKDSFSISSNITYVVFEDRHQRLWVGSQKGLDLLNRSLDRFDQHFFYDIPVRSIYQDRSGNLWVGSDRGLYWFDEEQKKFTKPFSILFDTRNVIYNTIPTIAEDHQGNLWVGTSNAGIYVYDFQSKTFKRFYHQTGIEGTLSNNDVRSIISCKDHKIWISTYGGGVNLFQPETENFKVYAQSGD